MNYDHCEVGVGAGLQCLEGGSPASLSAQPSSPSTLSWTTHGAEVSGGECGGHDRYEIIVLIVKPKSKSKDKEEMDWDWG